MPRNNWRDAISDIDELTGPFTEKQKALAAIAGIDVPKDLPQLVARLRLQYALAGDLGIPSGGVRSSACTEGQLELITKLKGDSELTVEPADAREASAWIYYFTLKARRLALEKSQIEAGDIVEVTGSEGRFEEVSSIGSDGRVHFKGGGGAGAWPDRVTVQCRRYDESAQALELKRKASNEAARRSRTGGWSGEKHRELAEFQVETPLTMEDVEQLREVIESADDEKPLQTFIENHPQILGALLDGNTRFCLSRSSLAGRYIPDFLVSDVDSLGVRWILVELETPNSSVTLKDTNDFEHHARRGISQIREWREWFQDNTDFARRSKRHNGLGLVDIRAQSEGLVLVGRRALLHANTHTVRNPIREENRIRVQTYDWLLEQLEGILEFGGPPGFNPYMIQPLRDEEF